MRTQATPAGACGDDANATQVLSAEGQKAFGGPVSCAVLASVHACNHPTHGARVREHCKATCGACPGTCDPDDATVGVATATTDNNSDTAATAATDVNTTAAVPGDDDDDRSAASWGGSLGLSSFALQAKVANLEKELDVEKAAYQVLTDDNNSWRACNGCKDGCGCGIEKCPKWTGIEYRSMPIC